MFFCVASPARPFADGNPLPLSWVNTNVVRNPFGPQPVKLMVPVTPPNAPSTPAEEWQPPVAPRQVLVRPTTTWVSLDNWAAQHGVGKPHFLSNQPVTTYAIGSPNGVMVLAIGSREATWNGIEIHLGFGPQIIDGQIFVYGLDAQKNLEPLLCGPPLALPPTNPVIVIDPGHGGMNSGTHSILDGRFEKEFTLDWALRLAPLLAQEGWQVFLTRTNDVDDSLSNRVAFAEAHRANLFISLHFNSLAPDQTPAGIETYCVTPTGMPSTLTRGYPDPWAASFPNNAFDVQNLQLAIRLESTLLHATRMEDRGVCRARFIGVLHGQRRPAVLVEAGFLSNPGDARQIETPAFRQKLAQAVADALRLKPETENPKPEVGSQKAEIPESGTNKLSWP
ncbi:MAG: N-acetylmuramoyl-L-alanine amidase family protein [Limisphaerales bacterium]